jgi:hypothetical protein
MRRISLLSFLAFFVFFLNACPAFAVQVKNLAVSKVGPTSATLIVKADVAVDVTVDYGSLPGSYSASRSSFGQARHEITLAELTPSSTVYYRLTITDSANPGSSIVLPEKSFHSSRSPGAPFSFAVGGDNRPNSDTTVQPATWNTIVGQMAAENIDLSLNVGDMIYGLSADSLDRFVAKYDGLFSVTAPLSASAPIYNAIGNHEFVNVANGKAAYEQEFTLPVNNGSDAATYGEHYYSFDNGNTHFIALSTEIPGEWGLITGNQKSWLAQDLAAASGKWIVVFMHRPLFRGTHPYDPWVNTSNTAGQANKAEIHNLFVQNGVDVVFEGHDHFYLHHLEDGIQYIITGGGGAPLYSLPAPAPGDVFGASTHEHVKVDETAASLHVSAIDTNGATLESFTLGIPALALSLDRAYWASYADYTAGNLSVDYSMTNNGSGDAANIQVVYLVATNGVTSQTSTPFAVSDLKTGQSAPFTVNYQVSPGVSFFRATTYATCNDLGGASYSFPGAAPGP